MSWVMRQRERYADPDPWYKYADYNMILCTQYRREFETGGIRLAEMLFKSNILAVVGGGEVPKYPPNKVIMWDDYQGRAIGELGFKTVVRNVKLRRDRIAVALEQKVLVYDLEDLRLVHQTETHSNLQGLLALCPSSDAIVLACPGLSIGQVRIDLLDTKRMKIIQAHNRNLACLSLTSNGKYVSTASEKGTLIRIFSTSDGSKIREVRRGTDPARIWSIAFSHEDMPHWLGVTSDKGTLHVFDLRGDEEDVEEGYQLVESTGASSTGSFSLLKVLLLFTRLTILRMYVYSACFRSFSSLSAEHAPSGKGLPGI